MTLRVISGTTITWKIVDYTSLFLQRIFELSSHLNVNFVKLVLGKRETQKSMQRDTCANQVLLSLFFHSEKIGVNHWSITNCEEDKTCYKVTEISTDWSPCGLHQLSSKMINLRTNLTSQKPKTKKNKNQLPTHFIPSLLNYSFLPAHEFKKIYISSKFLFWCQSRSCYVQLVSCHHDFSRVQSNLWPSCHVGEYRAIAIRRNCTHRISSHKPRTRKLAIQST